MRQLFTTLLLIAGLMAYSQDVTAYFLGNTTDSVATPGGGVCLMGGATEDDNAMKWFLRRANGGDVLILRASGSDGYQNYFYSDLGVSLNSVRTLVLNNAQAVNDPLVHTSIAEAEAIWFAGGNQWTYINEWRNSPVDSLINAGIQQRNIVIGGTSAGMAILGEYYFSAENGTIRSEDALSNPLDSRMTVDSAAFLQVPFMERIITDTHYDDPDRRGRHVAFLAKVLTQYGVSARGIACDEYTAVCVDTSGFAYIYGGHPQVDDNAYFLQVNCGIADSMPETFTADTALTWNRDSAAVIAYAVTGSALGTNFFNLNTWKDAFGGQWQYWSVTDGEFYARAGARPDCLAAVDTSGTDTSTVDTSTSIFPLPESGLRLYPNPAKDVLHFEVDSKPVGEVRLSDINGQICFQKRNPRQNSIPMEGLAEGVYLVEILTNEGIIRKRVIHRH